MRPFALSGKNQGDGMKYKNYLIRIALRHKISITCFFVLSIFTYLSLTSIDHTQCGSLLFHIGLNRDAYSAYWVNSDSHVQVAQRGVAEIFGLSEGLVIDATGSVSPAISGFIAPDLAGETIVNGLYESIEVRPGSYLAKPNQYAKKGIRLSSLPLVEIKITNGVDGEILDEFSARKRIPLDGQGQTTIKHGMFTYRIKCIKPSPVPFSEWF